MKIAERPPGELRSIYTGSAVENPATTAQEQFQQQIRGLIRLCRQFVQQYQAAQATQTCLERSWWRQFNQLGVQLREALEQARLEEYEGLPEQEIEQAYFQLIQVAYFFAPGGVAEALWPTLLAEPAERVVR